MVTVLQEGGLRVVIYADDHAPAHVHVFGDGETKIRLVGANGMPEVVRVVGAKIGESRRALRIVRHRRDVLLHRWIEMHG